MRAVAPDIELLLSAQRATLGLISSRLRALAVRRENKLITLEAFFVDGPTDLDQEDIEEVATEIVADFIDHTIGVTYKKYVSSVDLRKMTYAQLVYLAKD